MITKEVIKFVQVRLQELGKEPGTVDGDYGPKTLAALTGIAGIPPSFSKRRKLVAFIQLQAQLQNIDTGPLDGYWGPQTQYAYSQLKIIAESGHPELPWRPESLEDVNPNNWPSQGTDAELIEVYGEPGTGQVMLELPFLHRLSWDTETRVSRMQCHQKVHDSIGRVLQNVLETYGIEQIRELRLDVWGGCYNKRKMRGGDRWSMHSWGIALDYDPNRNRLKWGRDRSRFAREEYEDWWKCWEIEGWVSLGRLRNFDWMHVQAAKL